MDGKRPWTERYLRQFCEYTGVNPKELIPEEVFESLGDWSKENYNEAFLAECRSAIDNYFKERGKVITPQKLSLLAGQLCSRLESSTPSKMPSKQRMQDEIMSLLLDSVKD